MMLTANNTAGGNRLGRPESQKLKASSLRTTNIDRVKGQGARRPTWQTGKAHVPFRLRNRSSGSKSFDTQNLENAWRRELVGNTALLSRNKPKENIFTAELTSQLTAALLLLSVVAPYTYFSDTRPSIFIFQFSLTASLFHLWSAISMLPTWQIATKRCKYDKLVSPKKIMGAAMLVAGGTVGAGIVALPVKTAVAGLIPSTFCLIGGWAFMLLASLVIVEVNMHCGAGSNFTSMTEQLLGKKWKVLCAALYIFVYTATLIAYIAESATFLSPIVQHGLGVVIHSSVLSLGFTAICGAAIGMGSKMVDSVNSVCLGVAFAAFAVLLACSGSTVAMKSLLYFNWSAVLRTMPIMVVAFTFHNMIPSLASYLGSASATRKALVIGTTIPLVMYIIWEVLILGSLPPGSSIASVGEVLMLLGGNKVVLAAVNIFSLFAIITSFLGVGMGCLDFLKDLVGQSAHPALSRSSLLLLTMCVPASIACLCPQLFVAALEVSGILRLVLFAVIPALMMMRGPWAGDRVRGYSVVAFFSVISAAIIGIDLLGKLALF